MSMLTSCGFFVVLFLQATTVQAASDFSSCLNLSMMIVAGVAIGVVMIHNHISKAAAAAPAVGHRGSGTRTQGGARAAAKGATTTATPAAAAPVETQKGVGARTPAAAERVAAMGATSMPTGAAAEGQMGEGVGRRAAGAAAAERAAAVGATPTAGERAATRGPGAAAVEVEEAAALQERVSSHSGASSSGRSSSTTTSSSSSSLKSAAAAGEAGFSSNQQQQQQEQLGGEGLDTSTSSSRRSSSSVEEEGAAAHSLQESFRILASSLEIRCLAVMSLAQGLTTNLMEFAWKSHIKILYPSPGDFTGFLGDVATWTGVVTGALMVATPVLFDRLGWRGVASATPQVGGGGW